MAITNLFRNCKHLRKCLFWDLIHWYILVPLPCLRLVLRFYIVTNQQNWVKEIKNISESTIESNLIGRFWSFKGHHNLCSIRFSLKYVTYCMSHTVWVIPYDKTIVIWGLIGLSSWREVYPSLYLYLSLPKSCSFLEFQFLNHEYSWISIT